MKKSPVIFLVLIFLAGLYGLSFAQDGKNKQKKRENIELDTFIDAFFTDRKGDLPEMLKRQQIRVLVVPSRSTYFLDKAGQPRGLDYELHGGSPLFDTVGGHQIQHDGVLVESEV